jgi:hypothetical protein
MYSPILSHRPQSQSFYYKQVRLSTFSVQNTLIIHVLRPPPPNTDGVFLSRKLSISLLGSKSLHCHIIPLRFLYSHQCNPLYLTRVSIGDRIKAILLISANKFRVFVLLHLTAFNYLFAKRTNFLLDS